MPGESDRLTALRRQAYTQRQEVARLLRAVIEGGRSEQSGELAAAQQHLRATEIKLGDLAAAERAFELIGDDAATAPQKPGVRGSDTTGLEVTVIPYLDYVPTAFYHLLNKETDPLLTCQVKVTPTPSHPPGKKRRLRLTAFIEGYTAKAIWTVELAPNEPTKPVKLLPTLFPDRARELHELTRATVNVLAEDLDSQRVEIHITYPVWLLARNSAIFEVRDAHGAVKEYYRYLAAFVTPHDPHVQGFLREAAEQHLDKQLAGELGNAKAQARAIYNALREIAQITYVNSVLDFNPTAGATGQRVRLPRESLTERQANCLDGALLFASLLEALGLEPAIVTMPGHALVAWRAGKNRWTYLETTVIRSHEFDEAVRTAGELVSHYVDSSQTYEEPRDGYRLLPLSELRTVHGVTPLD